MRSESRNNLGTTALTAIAAAAIAALACTMLCLVQPAQAQAAAGTSAEKTLTTQVSPKLATQSTTTYTLGSTASGYVTSDEGLYYAFTIDAPGADVSINVTNEQATDCYLYARIEDASGSSQWSDSAYATTTSKNTISVGRTYLPKGSYKMNLYCTGTWYNSNEMKFYPRICKFSFKIAKVNQIVKAAKTSGTFKVGTSKDVSITYNSTDYYAKSNLKASSSKPKVASASLSNIGGSSATLTITPKTMGKAVISVKLAGGNTVKYTAYVTNTIAYIAKGEKTTLTKPIGVSKVKFANKNSKSKKVAITTNKGKVTAKKQGRAAIVAKKGKITYNYNVVVTDYAKLAKKTYNLILEYVPNPDEVKVNYAYKGYYKISGIKVPVVYVDYSFGNETGGNSRNKLIAWYDDALDVQMQNVATANNVISKKSIKI